MKPNTAKRKISLILFWATCIYHHPGDHAPERKICFDDWRERPLTLDERVAWVVDQWRTIEADLRKLLPLVGGAYKRRDGAQAFVLDKQLNVEVGDESA